mgnify:CR=1 FL=1
MKKAGAADYEKVADASFGGTGWQAVAFEEVKDVTDVKLVPTATTGDEANKFSAAAEIRVMGRFQDEEVEVNKADLTALVEKAEVLKEKDYTSETWKPFAEALKEAQAVLAKEDASQAEVDAAQTSLQTAMDGLKKPGTTDNKNPGAPNKGQAVQTGDATSFFGWGAAGIFGLFAAAAAFFERKRRRQ